MISVLKIVGFNLSTMLLKSKINKKLIKLVEEEEWGI